MKNLNMPTAIIIATIIICITAYLISSNDPLANCMETVMKTQKSIFGLRKGYFYRSCLLNLNMSYEQMILTVADNGLSSQRIHFGIANTGLSSH